MWVHIAIFAVIAGIGLSRKAGWLHLDGLADSESVRLFLLVAVCSWNAADTDKWRKSGLYEWTSS